MTTLAQIIGVERGVRAETTTWLTQAKDVLRATDLMQGRNRTYAPTEGRLGQPDESQRVQVNPERVFVQLRARLGRWWDLSATKKAGDTRASANVVLDDGTVLLEDVPVDMLIFLEGQLAELLKIEPADFDGSEASLDQVDKGLRQLRHQKLLSPKVFGPLVAYVGEVIRNRTQGRWEMRRGADVDRTWEPWIVDPSGRSCPPFAIYKELLEYGRSASLRGWVAGTLATWGHRARR